MIKLVNDTVDKADIDELILWLQSKPRLTKGPLTLKFEQKWSEWLGVKYSVFVPMLIKAIQEQQAIIEDLKARIETLEAK